MEPNFGQVNNRGVSKRRGPSASVGMTTLRAEANGESEARKRISHHRSPRTGDLVRDDRGKSTERSLVADSSG
jgi:hypothetical protein